jgi:hypothetical protein
MTDKHRLPVPVEEPPEIGWLDDVDTHIIEVTRHDTHDIVVGRQYYVLMLEDADGGRLLTTTVTSRVTDQN